MSDTPSDAELRDPIVANDPVRSVSVVIPAADEAENIGELIERIQAVLEGRAKQSEIVVVVPHPDDPTGPVARAQGARVLVQKRPGYGGALKEGLLAARGDYVVTMDGDHSHPPEKIADLLENRDAAEVVVCSRYLVGSSADASLSRRFLSWVLNFVYSRMLALPVRDTSSGFRIYRGNVLKELDLRGEKYDVLQEILVKVYCLGWRVAEIPFGYESRAAGESHARVFEFAPHFLNTFRRLWKVRNHFSSADYDSRAYDSIVIPQRYWQRKRFEIVNRMAGDVQPRLDIGCGSSRIIQSRPDSVGLDIEMRKLRFLRATNTRLIRGSTYTLPFADDSFRVVVHSQVIEHIPYDRAIFTELNRVMQLGGTLVIGTPDYARAQWRIIERLYELLMPNGYGDDHITKYTRYQLTEELASAGFAVLSYEYILGGELVMKCVKREDLEPGV